MAKVETVNADHMGGGPAEIEHAVKGPERFEAPNLKAPPSVKTPPTAPAGPTADQSARAAVIPIWRRRPSLRASLMAAGILAIVAMHMITE